MQPESVSRCRRGANKLGNTGRGLAGVVQQVRMKGKLQNLAADVIPHHKCPPKSPMLPAAYQSMHKVSATFPEPQEATVSVPFVGYRVLHFRLQPSRGPSSKVWNSTQRVGCLQSDRGVPAELQAGKKQDDPEVPTTPSMPRNSFCRSHRHVFVKMWRGVPTLKKSAYFRQTPCRPQCSPRSTRELSPIILSVGLAST